MLAERALVVLSGGQDSTTCLYWAKQKFREVSAVTFMYGQRHSTELEAAREIAVAAGVPWQLLGLAGVLQAVADSALLAEADQELRGEGGRPDRAMPQGLPTSFVPGRNLLMLSSAAALAVKLGAKDLVTGVCQTDYSGYPDCRSEFIQALEVTLDLAMPSSAGPFKIHTPLMHLTKAQTVRLGKELPGCWEALARTVTCYQGLRPGCGDCPACALRAKGFAEAGETDPAR